MRVIKQQSYMTSFKKSLFSITALVAGLVSSSVLAGVATYNVTVTTDTVDAALNGTCADVDGQCSLRAAIQEANNSGGAQINLPSGTYTLTRSGVDDLTSLNGDLDIVNSTYVTVSGSTLSSSPTIIEVGAGWSDRIFQVLGNAHLTLENLIIRGGNATGNGGSVWASDTSSLILRNCRITGNQASGSGGGISALGTLFSIENSRIDNNTSNVDGGGIDARATTTNTIRSSTIDNNTAINRGGGINADSVSGTVSILNTTISSNTAQNGGGLNAIQNVNLYNSSITNNTAAPGGTPGHGGGIYLVNSLSIRNSIVAGNTASYFVGEPVSTPDCYTSTPASIFLASQNYNLVGDMTGCAMDHSNIGEQLGVAGSPIAPLFGPLQDNGGPTPTHALLAGSPAIDAANPNGCVNEISIEMTSDQRGFTRSIDGDLDGAAVCDLGSVEVVAAAVTGGGGGGCTVSKNSRFDPIFPALVLFALIYLGLRRKQS